MGDNWVTLQLQLLQAKFAKPCVCTKQDQKWKMV